MRRGVYDALSFPDTEEKLVESIGHHSMHSNEVVDGAEASSGDVTLVFLRSWLALHDAGQGIMERAFRAIEVGRLGR